jgi:hypothetical protein
MSKYKKDLELKRQIKEMEDKLRSENAAQVQPDAEDSKISFDQWWIIINGKVSMRPHLKEILLADFRARGLSKREDEAAYDNALKLFGIKW